MNIDPMVGAVGTQVTALQTRENSLLQTGRVPTDAAKIDKGAKEFEAVLLGNWLQQAEQSFATIPGSDDDQEAGRDEMMSMGVQSLATSMAQSGGLGIGRMIAKAMHHIADKGNTTGSLPASGKTGQEPASQRLNFSRKMPIEATVPPKEAR